ncbi:hypothetical protein GGI25_004848 [Coemansia spiralis]|uniref:Uncharacterized protein n=2 Tax=Coemansia TaxID=4863 RepID=A0A9W8G3S2_9FUNG|nr:hypothetical protein EDC05_003567 [Coemansia umbellata]KAJ2621175.1 hypothetical protein GGI26_004343 [Coemansia sp. RSA 1358]KAJ2673095.1 hypothetical protein GGI25_004848 [Coemansia spiralis]
MLIEPNNLSGLLRRRSSVLGVRPNVVSSCIYPNYTLYNVETPDCYFRRFTPDGKFLIAFNRSLSGLQVYHVLGASASTQQLLNASKSISKSEFWHFFKLAWSQTYTGFGENLHRDLCLVTSNMCHLIIVRLKRSNDFGSGADQLQNESQRPNVLSCIKAMEDITILVVDIQSGNVTDKREYPGDIIYLSGHNGISLYEDQLCFLSLKNQCLRILRINSNGTLVDEREIGWYTNQDDVVYDDMLQMREEQCLALQREKALKRKRDIMQGASFSGCFGDAQIPQRVKQQRISRAKNINRPQPYHLLFAGEPSANTSSIEFTPEALNPGPSSSLSLSLSSLPFGPSQPQASLAAQSLPQSLSIENPHGYDVHCPELPVNTFTSSATSISFSGGGGGSGGVGERLPFIFPFSPQAQEALNNNGNDADAVLASRQQDQTPGTTSWYSLFDSINPLLAMSADRAAAFMPLQALHRLPPHYRLMFARAMQPAGRMENLADSDVPTIESSLVSAPHSGLKQRLLGALFIRAKARNDNGLSLQYFYRTFRQYEGLVLWRAQFVTRNRMLLRFVPLQVATSRSHVPRSSSITSSTMANSFTVLAEYDIIEARFVRIWDSSDRELCEEIEKRLDVYRAPMASSGGLSGSISTHAPSLSNDVYLRDAFEFTQSAIRTARSGGPIQAARKASALLPFAPQCTQESPLLDPSRFKCNLRIRQSIERFRPASLAPIRFYDRATGAVKFVLSPTPYHPSQHLLLVNEQTALQPLETVPPSDAEYNGGVGVLASGAVLLPSSGSADDMNMANDGSPAANSSNASSPKSGIMYLLHPFLPLILSSRNDSGSNSLSVSNIHFRQG